jgi:hypothetical protein
VEVFANDRQAMIAAQMQRPGRGLNGYSFGDPTTIQSIEMWNMTPTNQGFMAARESRIWEPAKQ